MNAQLTNAFGYQGNNMALPVPDVDAAVPFYEKVLGFQVVARREVPNRTAILGRDGVQIGLTESGGDPTQDGCAFHVTDVEALFKEFASNGLEKHDPKFEIEDHGESSFKVFYVVAPDGLCYWFGERQEKVAP